MWRSLLIAAILLTAVACGSGPEPSSGLECGDESHPCNLTEVADEKFERTLQLGDSATAIIRDGGTNTEAADMLRSQDDVVEVSHDDDAVRFRVDGAREHWILSEGHLGTLGTPSRVGTARQSVATVAPHVVGEERISKKALVLSPFRYEFGVDEGEAVAAILADTRGYSNGGVDFIFAENHLDTAVSIDVYKNLNIYDVVHVVTHGATICENDRCRTVILPFNLEAFLPTLEGDTLKEKLGQIEAEGVATWQDEADNVGVELTADFFTMHYGEAGLENAMIYFATCELLANPASDLVEAVRGDSSVVFAWDDTVRAAGALPRALELYTDLSENGYPASIAFGRLSSTSDGFEAQLQMRGPEGATDVRIRDVVEILDPATDDPLGEGGAIGIIGEVGDGEPDIVPYTIRVDGIVDRDSADTEVEVTIDGVTSGWQPLADGRKAENDRWTISGEIELPYDLTEDTEVFIEARAALADGGESADESSATLTGDPQVGQWEMTIRYSRTPVDTDGRGLPDTATATLTLAAASFQPDSDKISFEVSAGTVAYDPNKQDRFCIVQGDLVRFAVTPEMATGSRVVFDMTTDPIQFEAFITVDGPRYQADYSCRAGTGDDAPEGYQEPETQTRSVSLILLDLTEQRGVLSADATGAAGTVTDDQTGVMPGAIVDVSYTLTKTD